MNSETRKKMETTLRSVGQLPTLPVVYSRLQKVLGDPRVSAQEVGSVIEQDQSLASKVLKIVNSAYYSFPRRISTLSQAVVILGFNEVKNLALSISVINAFGEYGNTAFDRIAFWKHSLAVAVCAGCIAKKAGAAISNSHEEAFVAGLLHDIGKIVEDQFMHDIFQEAFQKGQTQGMLLFEAEKATMGFTHQETGEFITELWKLPSQLVITTSFHHSPLGKKGTTNAFALVSLVHVADIIVRSIGLGSGGDPFIPPLIEECWNLIGLSTNSVESIVTETTRSFEEIGQFLLVDTLSKEII